MKDMSLTDIQLDDLAEKPLTLYETVSFLREMMQHDWFYAIKLGSEVEGNTLDEVALIRSLFPSVPLRFKIGGCGAKNDIKAAFEIGVDHIILPMSETVYALENFIEIYVDYRAKYEKTPLAALNVETKTMVKNLPEFLPFLEQYFTSITIGRSDLSGSMKANINSQEVLDTIEEILGFAGKNLPHVSISIGGKITPLSGKLLYRTFGSRISFLNTKFAYLNPSGDVENSIKEALFFEILLYYVFYVEGHRSKDDFVSFMTENRKRMER